MASRQDYPGKFHQTIMVGSRSDGTGLAPHKTRVNRDKDWSGISIAVEPRLSKKYSVEPITEYVANSG
jgi:hypothetical protein